jgi:hypothetical protein
MYEPCGQTAKESIGHQPAEMKGSVVKKPSQPRSRRSNGLSPSWRTYMKRIGHHYRAAHPQTMKASQKTDE